MNKDKISNYIFIGMFILFWFIIIIYYFIHTNTSNLVLNRSSYTFNKFTISSFLDNSYQDNFEESCSDQLPLYNYFQGMYPKISNYINYNSISLLNNKDKYIKIRDINIYNNYLLYDSINDSDLSNLDDDLDYINYLIDNTDSNIYIYNIYSDSNIDFYNNKYIDIDNYIINNSKIDINNFSSLKINSFNDYKKYFYRIDHHLNHEGSNRAYNDIANLLGLDIINNKGIVCFKNKKTLGSKSKQLALDGIIKEDMCVYDYEYPEFNITIDNNSSSYGNSIDYLNDSDVISYSTIYGSDYSEIVFTNNSIDSDKNILIYSNSYSNSLNKLIGSHYKNTYVIDGRYNNDFDMVNYIKDKDIDDVLIISNKMLFFDNIKWGEH